MAPTADPHSPRGLCSKKLVEFRSWGELGVRRDDALNDEIDPRVVPEACGVLTVRHGYWIGIPMVERPRRRPKRGRTKEEGPSTRILMGK